MGSDGGGVGDEDGYRGVDIAVPIPIIKVHQPYNSKELVESLSATSVDLPLLSNSCASLDMWIKKLQNITSYTIKGVQHMSIISLFGLLAAARISHVRKITFVECSFAEDCCGLLNNSGNLPPDCEVQLEQCQTIIPVRKGDFLFFQ